MPQITLTISPREVVALAGGPKHTALEAELLAALKMIVDHSGHWFGCRKLRSTAVACTCGWDAAVEAVGKAESR